MGGTMRTDNELLNDALFKSVTVVCDPKQLQRELAAAIGREEGKQIVITQLERELAECKAERDALTGDLGMISHERGELIRQRDALKADAERYRWLRDCCPGMPGWNHYQNIVNYMSGTTWDTAIDAAMKEGKT